MSDFWDAVLASLFGAGIGGAATAWGAAFQARKSAAIAEKQIASSVESQRYLVWITELRKSLTMVSEAADDISRACDDVSDDHRSVPGHGNVTDEQYIVLLDAYRRANRAWTVHEAFIPKEIDDKIGNLLESVALSREGWEKLVTETSVGSYACCRFDMRLSSVAEDALALQGEIARELEHHIVAKSVPYP